MVTFKNEDKAVDLRACIVANGTLSKSSQSRAWDLDGDGELGKPSLLLYLSFVVDSINIVWCWQNIVGIGWYLCAYDMSINNLSSLHLLTSIA